MAGLHELEVMLKVVGNQYMLINKRQLLEKWMTPSAERLQLAFNILAFRFLKQDDFLN